jgi:hypothetical protein
MPTTFEVYMDIESANNILIGIGVQGVILVASTIFLARWLYRSFKRG